MREFTDPLRERRGWDWLTVWTRMQTLRMCVWERTRGLRCNTILTANVGLGIYMDRRRCYGVLQRCSGKTPQINSPAESTVTSIAQKVSFGRVFSAVLCVSLLSLRLIVISTQRAQRYTEGRGDNRSLCDCLREKKPSRIVLGSALATKAKPA